LVDIIRAATMSRARKILFYQSLKTPPSQQLAGQRLTIGDKGKGLLLLSKLFFSCCTQCAISVVVRCVAR
jgi:hypothetical protein